MATKPKARFISPQYLKDNSSVEDNVNDNIIYPVIDGTQKFFVEPITGTDLYDKLQNDISSGSLTGLYKTLVDEYIVPYMVEMSVYNLLPKIAFHYANRSVEKGTGENSEAATMEEVEYLRKEHNKLAETIKERMLDFLRENDGQISEWSVNSGLDNVDPQFGAGDMAGDIFIGNQNNSEDCAGKTQSYPGRYRRVN